MGCPVYAGLKTYTPLEAPTCHIYLIPRRHHYKFGNGTSECLSYPYKTYFWALIQCNEAACHQIPVIVPGGEVIIHRVSHIGDDDSKLFWSASKAKDPISQLEHLGSQRLCGA